MPSEEEWSDADMGVEELTGKPTRVTPEQGIARMEARLKLLQERLASLADKPWREKSEPQLLREIHDVRCRLAEYQTQLKGRN